MTLHPMRNWTVIVSYTYDKQEMTMRYGTSSKTVTDAITRVMEIFSRQHVWLIGPLQVSAIED